MDRAEAYNHLDWVWKELRAAEMAVAEALRVVRVRPAVLRVESRSEITVGVLQRCQGNLELTYVIRLFAEFEGILLDYWQNRLGRVTRPRVSRLIERIAAARRTSPEVHQATDEVREHRNKIVHEQTQTKRLRFKECLTRLRHFLSWLPPKW